MTNKYRHELKYELSFIQYHYLIPLIKTVMRKDENAKTSDYNIRSLYFDDYYRSALNDKEDGILVRKKYRIRMYNTDASTIKLECKFKRDNYIYKESVDLSKAEFQMLVNGEIEFLLKKDNQLAQEFYVDYRSRILRPKVVVDYEREAYVEILGNVRVTFDKNIRATLPSIDFFDKDAPSYHVLEPNTMILEIKFTGILPEKIRQLFRIKDLTQQAYSKFVMCVYKIESLI